jgi:hypothetical protein
MMADYLAFSDILSWLMIADLPAIVSISLSMGYLHYKLSKSSQSYGYVILPTFLAYYVIR